MLVCMSIGRWITKKFFPSLYQEQMDERNRLRQELFAFSNSESGKAHWNQQPDDVRELYEQAVTDWQNNKFTYPCEDYYFVLRNIRTFIMVGKYEYAKNSLEKMYLYQKNYESYKKDGVPEELGGLIDQIRPFHLPPDIVWGYQASTPWRMNFDILCKIDFDGAIQMAKAELERIKREQEAQKERERPQDSERGRLSVVDHTGQGGQLSVTGEEGALSITDNEEGAISMVEDGGEETESSRGLDSEIDQGRSRINRK